MGLAEREASRTRRSVVASIIRAEPTGKGRPKSEQETKQRISLAILPSLYENVRKLAYVERRSISALIAQLLEQYVRDNQKKLDEYDGMERGP